MLVFVAAAAATPTRWDFVPTDTDCIKWIRFRANHHTQTLPGKLLVVGHQEPCGPHGGSQPTRPGMWGELMCMSPNGSQVGHVDVDDTVTGYKTGCVPPPQKNNFPPLERNHSCFLSGKTPPNHWSSSVKNRSDYYLATLATTNLTWTRVTKGDAVPSNGYSVGAGLGLLIARSVPWTGRMCHGNPNPPGCSTDFCCRTSVIPGYAEVVSNHHTPELGSIHFEDYGSYNEGVYELATCHPPTKLPWACSASKQCEMVPHGQNGSFATQQGCASKCTPPPPTPPPPPAPGYMCTGAGGLYQCRLMTRGNHSSIQECLQECKAPPPPPPAPGPSPPPPPPLSYTKPYLRFAMAIPRAVRVDCTVVQLVGNVSFNKTWEGYTFGEFSSWHLAHKWHTGSANLTVRHCLSTVCFTVRSLSVHCLFTASHCPLAAAAA